MNDQNQNAPDYGFILNQQLPTQEKRGPDKKIIIIIVGFFFLIILGAITFFTSADKKVNFQPDTSSSSGIELTDEEKAAATPVSQYFSNIASGKAGDGYDLFTTETQGRTSKEVFTKFATNNVGSSLLVEACLLQGKPSNSGQAIEMIYRCPSKSDHKQVVDFKFVVVKVGETYKIREYTIEGKTV